MSKPPSFQDLDASRPNIPRDTCPDINAVQQELLAVCDMLDRMARLSEQEEVTTELERASSTIYDTVHDRAYRKKSALELLREANGELRESGKYWRDCCKEICEAMEELMEELAP